MSLLQEVQRVLTNSKNVAINFNIYGLRITSEKLAEVAIAVGFEDVGVLLDRNGDPHVAEYSRQLKSIILPWNSMGTDTSKQAMVIHEGVHAWCHMRHTKGRLSSEEIACYIAQAIYRLRNGNPSRPNGPGGIPEDNLFYYAYRAADKVIAGTALPRDDVEALRGAILNHRRYRTLDDPPPWARRATWSGPRPRQRF